MQIASFGLSLKMVFLAPFKDSNSAPSTSILINVTQSFPPTASSIDITSTLISPSSQTCDAPVAVSPKQYPGRSFHAFSHCYQELPVRKFHFASINRPMSPLHCSGRTSIFSCRQVLSSVHYQAKTKSVHKL